MTNGRLQLGAQLGCRQQRDSRGRVQRIVSNISRRDARHESNLYPLRV
jgi:hypothetical protein